MAKRIRFSNPPVIEVVCGVQFGNLERLFAPHHGIFWKSIRKEFPVVQEAPPLDPIVESYEEGPSRLTIGVSDRPPLPRVWLLSDNEQSLIQLQRDRFYYNWKRSDNKVPYPSYDRVIVEFERHLLAFQEFVAAEKLGEIEFRQCELTYVNHIDKNMGLPEGEGGGGLLVDHVNDTTRKRYGPQAEQYLRNGQSISFSGPMVEAAYLEEFRAYSHEGRFLALVRCDRPTSSWRPLKVFRLEAISPFAPINSK